MGEIALTNTINITLSGTPKGLGDLEVAKEDIEGWAERVMR